MGTVWESSGNHGPYRLFLVLEPIYRLALILWASSASHIAPVADITESAPASRYALSLIHI